jgi:hypothetical protein
MRFLVYALSDPTTNEVRYVGKSSAGLTRPKAHRFPSRLSVDKTHKGNWIRKLQKEGRQYTITILYQATVDVQLDQVEQYWIIVLRQRGCRLTNTTDGGDGSPGLSPSQATRDKISRANTGQSRSAESRLRMSKAQDGHEMSEETKMKIRRSKQRFFRPVESIDPQTGLVTEYESIRAVSQFGLGRDGVAAALRGKLKTYKGLYWQPLVR